MTLNDEVECSVIRLEYASIPGPSGHMTSVASVRAGEGSSSVASGEVYFSVFLGVFHDAMRGQRSGMSYVDRL